jgi:hypothetical protein
MFEELHSDLRPYLLGNVLRHPLIDCDYAYPPLIARINRWYRHLQAIEAGEYTPNEWDRYHPELDPSARLMCYLDENSLDEMPLDQWLTAERLRFLGQYWTAPEILSHTSYLWPMVAGDTAPLLDAMMPAEIEVFESLPETSTIYRAHQLELLAGGCWYADPSIVLDWATNFPYNDHVSSGTIEKRHIRGVFTRNGETELIVDYMKVHCIETRHHSWYRTNKRFE